MILVQDSKICLNLQESPAIATCPRQFPQKMRGRTQHTRCGDGCSMDYRQPLLESILRVSDLIEEVFWGDSWQSLTILTETIMIETNPRTLDFLSVALRKRKRKKISGILTYFVSVACCCGLCLPNMIITKANVKESLVEFNCLSDTKAKAKINLQIFICNCFHAEGTNPSQKSP